MSTITLDAAATVRSLLSGEPADPAHGTTVTGLSTTLGDSIVATVYAWPAEAAVNLDSRLEFADMERGDRDADIGIVIAPTGLAGLNQADATAWNVHMTLPTLLRILGTPTNQ